MILATSPALAVVLATSPALAVVMATLPAPALATELALRVMQAVGSLKDWRERELPPTAFFSMHSNTVSSTLDSSTAARVDIWHSPTQLAWFRLSPQLT